MDKLLNSIRVLNSTQAEATEEAVGDSDADMEDEPGDALMPPLSRTARAMLSDLKDASSGDEEMTALSGGQSPTGESGEGDRQPMSTTEPNRRARGQEGESSSDAGSDAVMIPGSGLDTSGVLLAYPEPSGGYGDVEPFPEGAQDCRGVPY